jgi:hypothetical protein
MLAILVTAALVAAPAAAPKPATNTECPVLHGPVTAKSKTVVVRGQEYRICCAGCDKTLLKDPDKYLNSDGTIKPKPAK